MLWILNGGIVMCATVFITEQPNKICPAQIFSFTYIENRLLPPVIKFQHILPVNRLTYRKHFYNESVLLD